MACTAMGMSAQPEIMMIGIRGRLVARICCSPSPLSPGMRTSSTMHFGEAGMSWASSRNASADVYARASKPTLLTIRLKDSHTCGSSSTMYTVGVTVVMASPGNWDCAGRHVGRSSGG